MPVLPASKKNGPTPSAAKFEENYLATIEPSVKKMVDAIARLATVLTNAEHQCGSDFE